MRIRQRVILVAMAVLVGGCELIARFDSSRLDAGTDTPRPDVPQSDAPVIDTPPPADAGDAGDAGPADGDGGPTDAASDGAVG
jgi:hypothetical protein